MTNHNARLRTANDLAGEAEQITGTPDEVAERLRALLEAGPPSAPPRETAEAAARREQAAALYAHEVALLRYCLASDFAAARAWTATTAPLAVKELARRSPGGTWHRPAREWLEALASPTFYRDAGRRAAAAVGHPPADLVTAGRENIEAWAAERDLIATFPDFPSWTFPGRTTLVVFEPATPVEGELAPAELVEPKLNTPSAPSTAPDLDMLGPLELLPPPEAEPDDQKQKDGAGPVESAVEPRELLVMRPVAPLDIEGMTPRDLADEEDPHFDIVDPRELLIDENYQRGLSPKSIALIRRIVENWSWSKFKVPNCVRVDGHLHVVDGQHTAIAAASHPGIQAIPVLVSIMPEVADRAGAFLSHATNRLQATPVQMHRAALTAGAEEAVALDSVCRAAGVELLPFPPSGGAAYASRQTVAVVGIRRLIAKRGADRATEILSALADADLAPISGDHLRLAEALLCDEQYAGGLDAGRLTVALRSLTARTHAEARELAIAQRLPAWRALAAVIFRNAIRAKPKPRQAVGPASNRRRGA